MAGYINQCGSLFLFKKNEILIMKKLIIISLFFFFASSGIAQQKIGYIDSDAIMKQLPEAQDAQKQLDAQIKEWQDQLDKMEKDWKTKYDDYQNRKLTMSSQKRAETEKELMNMEEAIKDFRQKKFGVNGELFKLQEEVMKPIQNKIFKAIEKVAKEEEFDYVFDRSGDIIFLYTNSDYDLTNIVLETVKSMANETGNERNGR